MDPYLVDVVVKSVLGDERRAQINLGAGYPWYSCPYCTYPVYWREASPEHTKEALPATNCRCNNPWCIANPAMPLDAARKIVQAAQEAADAAARRQRDQRMAIDRIATEAASRRAAYEGTRAEAARRGACQDCALAAFRAGRRVKYVVHRSGRCPLAAQNRPQS